jgi:enterochelin esterase-like enzyme
MSSRRGRRGRARRRRALRRVVALSALVAVSAGAVVAVSAALGVDRHGARVIRFSVASRLVGQTLDEVAVVPRGASGAGRPLLVFLHGKGSGRENSNLDSAMFAALAAQGSAAPDVLFPDGGEDSYWHNRRSGAWASYVLHEVIPRALALLHADPRRVAIGGISMGGFGALELARLHPGRFCAVGGHSAAEWYAGADTPAGAFDDAQDFARHDIVRAAGRSDLYGHTPVWIDVGTEDPFRAADTTLAQRLQAHGANIQFHVWPGGHDNTYTSAHWGAYLAFYSRALADCTAL